jgi:class 3 adenylate cyclase
MSAVETVTVLITDLVGSTGLASRLGPVAADELRRDHFGVLRKEIDATSGHEVKNIGDGLMVVFQGAADAVACAVSIQQAVERRNRGAEEQLAIREGIALGDATCEDGDYFGMPVVEAARLCGRAMGGQILTTEVVRMIDGREEHSFNPLGEVALRGFPQPVPVYEVAWEPAGGWKGDVPLPPRLHGVPPVGYVGRVGERARVRACWDAARDGMRQALLVSGEPGIGKTRFTSHSAIEFHGDAAVVLFGHCEQDLGVPYGAWIQALSHLVEHAPEEALTTYIDRYGGELARLVPGLLRRAPQAPPPRQTDPETERYLLFSAVVGLLDQASIESPVVLVLDDLHWADRPTLALLRHVVAETHGVRLLVLATYRDSELSRDHPLTDLLADLRREDGIARLTLRGLSQGEVKSLMEGAAGHEMGAGGQALAREIAAETDGNPFFVGEMLRHLTESGALVYSAAGRWELLQRLDELGMPQSVREVIGRRVERLGEDCHAVLSCAAVIGRHFDLELLQCVVREDEDRLIDLLDAAVKASLLHESAERTGGFSFEHALINHTLYDELGATRRARLHRRVAEALEDLCGEDPASMVSELAYHWTAATAPVDTARALDYSRRAGVQALAKLAPDEAVRWFTQGMDLLEKGADPDPRERCELMICLGEAQRQAARPAFRETLLDAAALAEKLDDPDRMARAVLANTRGFPSAFGTVDTERVAAIERALQRSEGFEPARCAELLALETMELEFDADHEHRRALAGKALAQARESGDPRILLHVLRDHFHATWSVDTLQARERTANEMLELADHLDDPLARFWALDRTVHVAAESGRMRHAMEASAALLALTEELGQPRLRWHATHYASGLAQLTGELEEAERLAQAALHLGEQAGEPDAAMIYAGQIGTIRVEQGPAPGIVELLEQATEANPGLPAFEAGLCVTLCYVGREAEAASRLQRAAALRFTDVPLNQTYSTTLAMWARTTADVESAEAAAVLLDLIEPWGDVLVWNGASGYGAVASYLGMLAATMGSHERADEHFAAASRLHRKEGVKGWEAQNLCYWARSQLAAGDVHKARETALRSIGVAREAGHESSARRAEALISQAPIT